MKRNRHGNERKARHGRVVFIRALMLAARRMLAVGDEDSDSAARVLIASMLSEIDDAQDFYKKRLQEA